MAEAIWRTHDESSALTDPERLGDQPYDVAVVGAGVTGLTTALLQARAGRSVVLLEARRPGAVTTGRTTGKVSALQGTLLGRALRAAPREAVTAYVESTLAAQRWLRQAAGDLGFGLESRLACTYAPTIADEDAARAEREAARSLGLPVGWKRNPDLPVPAVAAVTLADQDQLDPGELVRALTAGCLAAGVTVVPGWRMRHVRQRAEQVTLTGARGVPDVRARHVVVATGAATVDRRLHFARLSPQRSYLLAFEVDEEPQVMGLSSATDSRSFRGARIDGRAVLLAGGAGHATGRGSAESERTAALRAWAGAHWPGAREVAAWSAQDYTTADSLPLVGSLGGPSPDVHLATGFNKWGLTSGVAAALALSGALLGERPSWAAPLYDRSWTLGQAQGLAQFQAGVVLGGARAAVGLVAGGETRGTRALRRCGSLPVCTHLGGPLRWNEVEQSLDCSLHGSRFSEDGEVLEGPATRPLPRVPGLGRADARPD